MQLTNLNYADDIALVSQQIEQAQQLLTSIETKVANIGIQLNSKKTEVMTYNHTLPVNITLEKSDTLITYVTHLNTWGHGWLAHETILICANHYHGRQYIRLLI